MILVLALSLWLPLVTGDKLLDPVPITVPFTFPTVVGGSRPLSDSMLLLPLLAELRRYHKELQEQEIAGNTNGGSVHGYVTGRVIYQPKADYLLGVVLPMTVSVERDGTSRCVVQDAGDLQVLESLYYTIDWVNSRPQQFPFTLGAEVLDTCGDPRIAASNSIRFITPTLLIRYSPYISDAIQLIYGRCHDSNDSADGSNDQKQDEEPPIRPVVGIIGSMSSKESEQMAHVVRVAAMPQVSHGATSFDLSDQNEFPYFMRTIPSDKYGIKAMVSLLLAFNWTYVSVVYDDSMYSLKSYSVLEDIVEGQAICLAATEKVEAANPNFDYNITFNKLLATSANVVLVLSTTEVTSAFFHYVCGRNATRQFTWIGLSPWTARMTLHLPVHCKVHENTLGVIAQTQNHSQFIKWYTNKRPSKWIDNNPWMAEYFEAECRCTYNRSLLWLHSCEAIEEECAGRVFSGFRQDPYVRYISRAVVAFADALKLLYDRLKCPPTRNFSEPICSAATTENLIEQNAGHTLTEVMRKMNFTDTENNSFEFFDGIDGPPVFSIHYFKDCRWEVAGELTCSSGLIGTRDSFRLTDHYFISRRLQHLQNVTSQCSVDCGQYEVKVYPNPLEPCCWMCLTCPDDAILRPVAKKKQLGDSLECYTCPIGSYPDPTRAVCLGYTDCTISSRDWYWFVVSATACVGILLTTAIMVVFWQHRNTPIVLALDRSSSFVMLFSCVLMFGSTFIFLAPPSVPLCSTIRCMLGICGTLSYSSIFAKTLRIMLIFRQTPHIPAALKSKYGVAFVTLAALGIELVLILIWMIVEPTNSHVHYDTARHWKETACNVIGPGCAFIMTLPLLLAGTSLVLAYQIRKVPDGFNETKMVSFVVYANGILLISFMVPLISDVLPYYALVASLAVLYQLMALAMLCGLYFPKVYIILMRPEKNTRQAVMSRTRTFSGPDCLLSDTSRKVSVISSINASPRPSLEDRGEQAGRPGPVRQPVSGTDGAKVTGDDRRESVSPPSDTGIREDKV